MNISELRDAMTMHRDRLEHDQQIVDKVLGLLVDFRLDKDSVDPVRDERTPGPPPTSNVESPTYAEVHRYIVENGPVRLGQVCEALGAGNGRVARRLRRLVNDGLVGIEGTKPHRRYVATPREAAAGASPAAAARSLSATASCDTPDELLELIRVNEPVTSARLREITGRPLPDLHRLGRELARRKLVDFAEEGPAREWRLVGERTLADEVEALIAAEPGSLTERRIALTLRASHGDVVRACAALLESDTVVLTDAGTYAPARRAAGGRA